MAFPARADIIQTQTFGPNVPDYFPNMIFNQYTGNLSDLTGIVVELSLTTVGGLGQVDNESIEPAVVEVKFGTSGWLIPSGVTLPSELTDAINPVTSYVSSNFTLAANDGDGSGVDTGGADYAQLAGATVTDSLSGSVASTYWSQYVGSGTFSIMAVINTYLNVTGGGGGVSQGSTPPTVNGYIAITYKTAAGGPAGSAPEPASLILLTSGLGGLAAWRYRRKRKDAA